jgi:hypothetical protein
VLAVEHVEVTVEKAGGDVVVKGFAEVMLAFEHACGDAGDDRVVGAGGEGGGVCGWAGEEGFGWGVVDSGGTREEAELEGEKE